LGDPITRYYLKPRCTSVLILGNDVSNPLDVSVCRVVLAPVTTLKRDEDPSVNTTAIVFPLYALSTLSVVPLNAESVANEFVPEAGETVEDKRVLNATPSTAFVLVVPTVRSSTVLNVPALDREKFKFNGARPNAEST